MKMTFGDLMMPASVIMATNKYWKRCSMYLNSLVEWSKVLIIKKLAAVKLKLYML